MPLYTLNMIKANRCDNSLCVGHSSCVSKVGAGRYGSRFRIRRPTLILLAHTSTLKRIVYRRLAAGRYPPRVQREG